MSPSVTIASEMVKDPADVVLDYLRERSSTVKKYDWNAGTAPAITRKLIDCTRGPWQMNSRISFDEERWFLERSKTAPWDRVPASACLADADPTVEGGSFDEALELIAHFWRSRPRGVGWAKTSMLLHLARPNLVPLLDNGVLALYASSAREGSSEAGPSHPDLSDVEVRTLARMRGDLLAAEAALHSVRKALRDSDPDIAAGEG